MQTMNQKVKAGYDRAAAAYSTEFRDQFKNEKHLDLLIDKLPAGGSVLDIGCGSGRPIDSYLVNNGLKVTGIDISDEQIKLARVNVPEAKYVVADMSSLREKEFEVDAVVSFYALFHIARETHLEVLKKMHSFLKPGGWLLITMGAEDWVGKEDDFCGVEMFWSHYGADKNKELVKAAGFEIVFDEIDLSGNEKHLVVLGRKG